MTSEKIKPPDICAEGLNERSGELAAEQARNAESPTPHGILAHVELNKTSEHLRLPSRLLYGPTATDGVARAVGRLVARNTELEEQVRVAEDRVAELQKAARSVCHDPTAGMKVWYVNADAIDRLRSLLPDQGGEGDFNGNA